MLNLIFIQYGFLQTRSKKAMMVVSALTGQEILSFLGERGSQSWEPVTPSRPLCNREGKRELRVLCYVMLPLSLAPLQIGLSSHPNEPSRNGSAARRREHWIEIKGGEVVP